MRFKHLFFPGMLHNGSVFVDENFIKFIPEFRFQDFVLFGAIYLSGGRFFLDSVLQTIVIFGKMIDREYWHVGNSFFGIFRLTSGTYVR